MKFIVALLFVAVAVSAQTTNPPLNPTVVALEARGHALYAKASKVLEENRHNHSHLLETLNHQVTELVTLLKDLHHLAVEDQVHREENLHKIHVIEERLVHLENRILEEIDIIEEHKGHPHKGKTVAEIVAQAEKLIKSGKEAVAKHPKAVEVGEINRELIIIEALVKAVQAKPAASDLAREEAELERQEATLTKLIERAAHHNGF